MSGIAPGLYTIRSLAHPDGFVGHDMVEEKSMKPEQILRLPQGVSTDETHWIVERPPGQDRVILMSRGAATAVIQDKVYSTPMDVPPPEPWIITARQNHGPNVYTIETSSREGAWVLPDDNGDAECQVQVRPLRSTKSLPPQFLPNSLWEIAQLS